MRSSMKKKKINLISFIFSIGFFIVMGIIFNNYSLNLSPLFMTFLLFLYAKFFKKVENLPSYIDLLLLMSIGVTIILLPSLIPSAFKLSFILKISAYGISAIGFAMLITLLFNNLELSLLFSIFISFLGSTSEGGENIGVSLFCASLSATMLSYQLRRRSQIIKASFLSGVIFFITFILESSQTLFMISSLNLNFLKSTLLIGVISLLIMIVILPIIVIGALVVFEFIFKTVTNISLLELSDFNHPLLRKMILEAPGTYQHSLVVANLSETAGEAIGANSLLARVGAYYHDIGKIPKAHYFIENQIPFRDVHKGLKPSISKMIIINHIKEGVELAKKYHLNPRIIDFITQHHGKTLVYYFYQRAKELEPQTEPAEEYRYPGPKPQSKETAIVALADTVEARSRTLEDPSPSRIEEMVRDVVRSRFQEGELDESNLTLKDLEKITQSFVRVLNALFHTRIDYPNNKNGKNKDKKSPKDKENKLKTVAK